MIHNTINHTPCVKHTELHTAITAHLCAQKQTGAQLNNHAVNSRGQALKPIQAIGKHGHSVAYAWHSATCCKMWLESAKMEGSIELPSYSGNHPV
eukprot:CAMPEP_0174380902 /NCGR_PEP_ID=MMETSP0811_2-20130205/123664_1 /TAXON_ID=73025 ORGANISM="Eutreptiella gymnastica-like, Strain CCMP1594" /NCGR_SAMPLE_ID=MMETSP0811_2 /ASSEMBLY_ACC=CAM_ASM_000667 /LENGTH=94 /DNA_ID=CAMNT_0015533885 /DNA_START=551 /DNA_END=835 /DNA_ORIENTATION=+